MYSLGKWKFSCLYIEGGSLPRPLQDQTSGVKEVYPYNKGPGRGPLLGLLSQGPVSTVKQGLLIQLEQVLEQFRDKFSGPRTLQSLQNPQNTYVVPPGSPLEVLTFVV